MDGLSSTLHSPYHSSEVLVSEGSEDKGYLFFMYYRPSVVSPVL